MNDLPTDRWLEYPVSQRDELIASQPTMLTTVGHEDHCHAIVTAALDSSKSLLCAHRAMFVIERYDYRLGVTMGDVFRPSKIITHLCPEHTDAIAREAGLIGCTQLGNPFELHDSGPLVDVLARFLTERGRG
jgi:hypothetical protein